VEAKLDAKAYAQLSEDDVKTLVVDDKWMQSLDTDIRGEMDRISQQLTSRVKELASVTTGRHRSSPSEWVSWRPR